MEKEKDSVSVEIINRFFDAIGRLISDGCIRGLQTFTRRYGLNRWNIIYLRENPEDCIGRFRASWLQYLVRDYHVSPYWLLLGSGDFYAAGFTPEIIKKLTKNCTKK